jgi:hypothetical protein
MARVLSLRAGLCWTEIKVTAVTLPSWLSSRVSMIWNFRDRQYGKSVSVWRKSSDLEQMVLGPKKAANLFFDYESGVSIGCVI